MDKKQPVVFLDRDGTINEEVGYLSDPRQLRLIPGAAEGIRELKLKGFRIVVITNQSGVARGYFDLDAVRTVNERLIELLEKEGAKIDGIYVCPHHPRGTISPYNVACRCRKPSPALAQQAAEDLRLDLRRAYVIGDKLSDLGLALNLKAKGILVLTGYGTREADILKEMSDLWAWRIRSDLYQAVQDILEDQKS
ncbi:D-glycero-alpha-D-manno-heptose-1,7-bisphosphate 7-phosphatase [Thermosulfuriphilus sp.]